MSWQLFLHTTFLFWVIMDSVGSIPIFVSYLKDYDTKRQYVIVIRELLIALLVMLLFFFFGQGLFKILEVTESSLQITGGITIFLIGARMLLPKSRHDNHKKRKQEPLIVPLAVPAIAGPGILATIMLYSSDQTISNVMVLSAIFFAWLLGMPFLLIAPALKKILKDNGIIAIERIFAYLIILIGTKMMLDGIHLSVR